MSQFQYKSKVVRIEAYQLPPEDDQTRAMPHWFMEAIKRRVIIPRQYGMVTVNTEYGPIEAQIGDWIIKGLRNELYPCKDETFQEKYEPIDLPF